MKIQSVLICLAVLTGLCTLTADSQEQQKAATRVYKDPDFGFSFEPPKFDKLPPDATVGAFLRTAPAVDGFASNINVTVTQAKTTRDESIRDFLGNLRRSGFRLLSQKKVTVSEKDAAIFEYSGRMPGQGQVLHWLTLVVPGSERIYVITCTSTDTQFKNYEKLFRDSLDSFRLPKAK